MSSSRGSSWPRDQTLISTSLALAGEFFTTSTTWEAPSLKAYCGNRSSMLLRILQNNFNWWSVCFEWIVHMLQGLNCGIAPLPNPSAPHPNRHIHIHHESAAFMGVQVGSWRRKQWSCFTTTLSSFFALNSSLPIFLPHSGMVSILFLWKEGASGLFSTH